MPSIKKNMDIPSVKKAPLRKRVLESLVPPMSTPKKTGISGKTQGEKNESKPPRKELP
jgi:hypothetical protein